MSFVLRDVIKCKQCCKLIKIEIKQSNIDKVKQVISPITNITWTIPCIRDNHPEMYDCKLYRRVIMEAAKLSVMKEIN